MSTRASIQFKEGDETFFIYKHCDGYPQGVLPDLEALLEVGNLERREISCVATLFLLLANKGVTRLQDISYELTSSEHGDEEYRYTITKEAVDADARPRVYRLKQTIESI